MPQMFSSFVARYVQRGRDAGASIVEYGALIVIIGVIAGAIAASGIGEALQTNITNAVNQVFTNNDIGGGGE